METRTLPRPHGDGSSGRYADSPLTPESRRHSAPSRRTADLGQACAFFRLSLNATINVFEMSVVFDWLSFNPFVVLLSRFFLSEEFDPYS